MDTLEISPRDYHKRLKFNKEDMFDKDSYLSKSVLWQTYNKSLWEWKQQGDFQQTEAMKWGSIIDCLTTTPDEADELFVRKSDCEHLSADGGFRSKAAKEWRQEQLDNDKLILDDAELHKAHEHAKVLLDEHPVSSAIFAQSKTQVILHCKTKEGVNLKALADLVPDDDFLCDLKTCSDFSLSGFAKAIHKFGYHVQAGMYLIIWNNMFPNNLRKRFKHIWQNPATGEVAVTEMSSDDILTGQAMFRYLYNRLITAYRMDSFPMLTGDETPVISRPAWAQIDDEMLLENQEMGGIQ